MTSIELNPENSELWNEFVLNQPDCTPYHFTHWISAIEKAYNHKCSGYLITDSAGNIEAIVPFTVFRKINRSQYLCSLPFADIGGIISKSEIARQHLLSTLNKKIGEGALSNIELRERGGSVTDENLEIMKHKHAKVSMLLPLSTTADELLKSFKPKLRSQIKKAAKNGLITKVAQDDSLIDDFYDVISRNMRDLGSPVHSKLFFQEVMKNYGAQAFTCVVYKDEQPCAAGITLMTNINACIPWASSLRKYNKLAPNMMLYWTLLEHIADRGIAVLDFGRSTVNEGTYRFKKQWGANPVNLHWHWLEKTHEQNHSGPVTTSPLRIAIEACWIRLPLKVTTTIGPLIRKHISL